MSYLQLQNLKNSTINVVLIPEQFCKHTSTQLYNFTKGGDPFEKKKTQPDVVKHWAPQTSRDQCTNLLECTTSQHILVFCCSSSFELSIYICFRKLKQKMGKVSSFQSILLINTSKIVKKNSSAFLHYCITLKSCVSRDFSRQSIHIKTSSKH